MKRLIIITAVLSTAFISEMRAQDRTDQSNPTSQTATPPPPLPRVPSADDPKNTDATTVREGEASMPVAQHRRASEVIGMNLQNRQDETVGAIADLVLDLSTRRVTGVVISSGGFLGIADELSLMPPSSLKLNAEGDGFMVDITKDQLTNAPHFQGKEYPDLNDPKYMMNVYKAYNAESYLDGLRGDDTADNAERRVVRASEVLGLEVKNHQDESIGDIHEVILNGTVDRVSSFVVSSGGFLGIGTTLSVVPAESVTTTKEAVIVDATRETLERSPRFNADAWPKSMNDPDYLVGIYEPYQFRSDTRSDVDVNAKFDANRPNADEKKERNDGDKLRKDNPSGVTAQDQGNNPTDVDVTAKIRRKLVADDELSFSAKNIRVITREGKITLVGQVSSQEEMDQILKLAKDESGSDAVTNHLTVED